jgi:aspartyl-tRNA synthetase
LIGCEGWPESDELERVEAFKFSILKDAEQTSSQEKKTRKMLQKIRDDISSRPFMKDTRQRLEIFQCEQIPLIKGLSTNTAQQLTQQLKMEAGDFIVLLSENATPRTGGWTTMGRVRDQLHKSLLIEQLLPNPQGFDFVWVVDFPLFSPSVESEPGQGGSSGFAATHHPFTAPKTAKDLDLLSWNPMAATAAHYDLVVNGVELGGGSRRIHDGHVQEYILRDILRVPEEGIISLQHLLDALKVGCPPHAGMALGFDRLLAVLLGRGSVKEVIAFPKNNRGEDVMVGSPNAIRPEQLKPYYLSMMEAEDKTLE